MLHVLDRTTCPLESAATVAGYLAGESARQCGPCVNGLPRMAATLQRLASPGARPRLVAEIERLRALVARPRCVRPPRRHRPLRRSTMRVFADHVDGHLRG